MSNEKGPLCPICSQKLVVSLARGRKSGKQFVMLKCPADGRHFRGFITHQPFVQQVAMTSDGEDG